MKNINFFMVLLIMLASCSIHNGRGKNADPGYLKKSKRVIFSAIAESKKYTESDSKKVYGKLLLDVSIGANFSETVYITSVSPFKPKSFKDVFDANACRFLGKANNAQEKTGIIFINIERFSCIDNMGNIYESDLKNNKNGLSAILTEEGTDQGLTAKVKRDGYKLNAGKNVVIRFNKPVNDIIKVTRVSGIEIKNIHELIGNLN